MSLWILRISKNYVQFLVDFSWHEGISSTFPPHIQYFKFMFGKCAFPTKFEKCREPDMRYCSPEWRQYPSVEASWRGASDPHGVCQGSSPVHEWKRQSPWREAWLLSESEQVKEDVHVSEVAQPREHAPPWGEEDVRQGRCNIGS